MSFFGLTSFGPENLIQSTLLNSNGFTLFYDEDFYNAFIAVANEEKSKFIKPKHLFEVLNKTFGFKPLDSEVKQIKEELNKKEDDDISWEEFYEALQKARINQDKEVSRGKQLNSYQKYYDNRFKHIRSGHQPSDVFKCPLVNGHNYGFYKFHERDLNNVRYPKKKSDETKYAEAIVMTGKQYMK